MSPFDIALRCEAFRQARIAAHNGNHRRASQLYAELGRLYVVEINNTVRTLDGLDKEMSK